MQRAIKILIIFLAVTFTAQACSLGGGPKIEPVELVWWKTFDDARMVEPLIQAFRAAYPHVTVTFVQKDVESYEDELIDALAAGQGPDIFTIHNDWVPRHQDKMAPAPEKLWNIKDYSSAFADVVTQDLASGEQIYAVPLALDVMALYYNKDILASAGIARPPATWQELVGMVGKLTRQDTLGNFLRSAIALGTADNINRAPDILSLLMLQNGTPIFSEGRGGAQFNREVRTESGETYSPGARALEFYTQFANPAKITYTWNSRSLNSIDAFSAGQAAMIFSYSYLRSTLEEKAPFLKYGIAPVPQIEGADLRVNFANYWAEGVSKQSVKQDTAWQFLKFITSKETLPDYYRAVKQVSPRIDVIEGQIADPDIGVFAENALSAKSFYKPDSAAVENIFAQMINDVVLRNVSAQGAVNAAVQKLNLLIRNF